MHVTKRRVLLKICAHVLRILRQACLLLIAKATFRLQKETFIMNVHRPVSVTIFILWAALFLNAIELECTPGGGMIL